MENTQLITSQNDTSESLVSNLTNDRVTYFCSLKCETPAEKVAFFNAMSNPDKHLGDCINLSIIVKDMFAEEIELTNETTGEVETGVRIVLIDDKGVSYQSVAKGVYSACKRLIAIFGMPTWEKGIKIVVRQIPVKKGSLLTLIAV